MVFPFFPRSCNMEKHTRRYSEMLEGYGKRIPGPRPAPPLSIFSRSGAVTSCLEVPCSCPNSGVFSEPSIPGARLGPSALQQT